MTFYLLDAFCSLLCVSPRDSVKTRQNPSDLHTVVDLVDIRARQACACAVAQRGLVLSGLLVPEPSNMQFLGLKAKLGRLKCYRVDVLVDLCIFL